MIEINTITTTATVIVAVITIFGVIFSVYRWYLRQGKQDKNIKSLREEQCLICYGMLACLEGLKQLNCNGPVTDARDKLSKYINQKAHSDSE